MHTVGRACAEASKWMRRAAMLLDVAAATIAVLGLSGARASPSWTAVGALALAISAALLRARATVVRERGLEARRQSLHAFAGTQEIAAVDVVDAESRVGAWGARLRTGISDDISAYYDPKAGAGPHRLRELVAYSAHFSRRLLERQALAAGAVAAVLLVVGLLALFGLIISPPGLAQQGPIFDAVLGTLLGVFCVRAAHHAFDSWRAALQIRPLAIQLTAPRELGRADIDAVVTKYELQVQTAPEPWTAIYVAMKPTLEREWSGIRAELPTKGIEP